VREGALEFTVFDLKEQEVLVRIRGEDVLHFEGAGPAEGDGPAMPDPVVAFVAAARLGMLTDPAVAPWLSGAEMTAREVDRASRQETCRVRVWNVAPGALRVLANLLLARTPERAEVKTAQVPQGLSPSLLTLAALHYPPPFRPLPFPVDYEMPDRSSRERFLQIALAGSPRPNELDTIYAGLDVWSRLPLLGGYPADHMKPWQSAAVPDPAFLLDPSTVEQAFPDLFLCDDDCYAAVINWAHSLHHSGCPVAGLLLR
jgi:hypothetical protein